MDEFKDCLDRPLKVGDRVGVAFSWSQASVGYIRIGEILSLEPFIMGWEKEQKTSPKMVFDSRRMILV